MPSEGIAQKNPLAQKKAKGNAQMEETKEVPHPLFSTCQPKSLVLQQVVTTEYQPAYKQLKLQREQVQVVVYHAPCNDGFASAVVAYLYNHNLTFLPVNHDQLSDLGETLKGKRVVFIDISPKQADLKNWDMEAYVILDHHISAECELKSVLEYNKVFDMQHSGCGLAWKYFYGTQAPMPLFLEFIQARDLWKQEQLEGCAAFTAGLHALIETCANEWVNLMNSPEKMISLIHTGGRLEQERMRRVERYVKKAVKRSISAFPEVDIYVINCTDSSCTSDAGAQLTLQNPMQAVGLLWSYDGERKEYHISIRSMSKVGPDVSLIAKYYGGGGHRAASGFTFKGSSIEDLFE